MDLNLADLRQKWNKTKLTKATTFWIVVGAVLLTLFLGFTQAGWVTASTAEKMAAKTSQDAVIDRLAEICIAQFNQDPQKEQKLTDIKELIGSSRRATYIKDEGWVTMPGETAPNERVAAECVRQLMSLDG